MARHDWCRECETTTMHHNNKCTICADRESRIALAKWQALTADEKFNDLRRRIEKLEQRGLILY